MGSRGLQDQLRMVWRGWSLTCLVLSLCATAAMSTKVHIVYMGSHHSHLPKEEVTSHHHRILANALGSFEAVEDSIIYSYKHLFSGFAAKLSPEHIDIISNTEGVISIFSDTLTSTQTTHTWNFLGLDRIPNAAHEYEQFELLNPQTDLWAKANYGKDVIIGVIDTGIWPEANSFHDEGFDPFPSRFKGLCEPGDSFPLSSCNKKIIGSRYYFKAFEATNGAINISKANESYSARDAHGHGTHVASTAAGRFTANASDSGWAFGTAKGGAPLARLAIYKVCWPITEGLRAGGGVCSIADVLQAMDDAVHDGVDILSISLSGCEPVPYFKEACSVSTFHAAQQGIVIVEAGGNGGPSMSTVINLHPWVITVAASTVDRDLQESITLGNSQQLFGYTMGLQQRRDEVLPLVFAEDVGLPNANKENASLCMSGTLDPAKVNGRVVLCLRGSLPRINKSLEVISTGGAGIILANTDPRENLSKEDEIPVLGCNVDFSTGEAILVYIRNTSNPTVKFGQVSVLGVKGSPRISDFSSVGPNPVVPDILKPDIAAPGEQILAAWTGNTVSPVGQKVIPKEYNIISGTSMATPHVSGVAALLKGLYPHWSPAAIKSAIMTTALIHDNLDQPIKDSDGNTATPFHFGGGLINPNAAADPGLIYDAGAEDYLLLMCALKFNSTSIKQVTGLNFTCPTHHRSPSASDLNLPSVTIANLEQVSTVKRTVTNVGPWDSVYKFETSYPKGTKVSVFPTELHFKHHHEKKSFYLTLERDGVPTGDWSYGSFSWVDRINNHRVRSPIVVGPPK